MNSTGNIIGRASILAWIVLTPAIAARAQSSTSTSAQSRVGTELSGVAGGSGLVAGGDFVAADGMWGVKLGAFSRSRRFGLEGAFEQSTRLSGLRYAGGDFVFQFPIGGCAARTVPFLHAGLGSLFFDSRGTGAFSFGGGIKHFLSERVGLRLGVQDRILFEESGDHRLDVYLGRRVPVLGPCGGEETLFC